MPEIKNAFIKGKMNKDLDERLIPNGEYRDALNIDVDYAESSDVGALKNILGNTQKDSLSLTDAHCIGHVKDTENDKIYWFITTASKDMIAEYDVATEAIDGILVDTGSVLNFNEANLITGVNVLDGVLYFTDNLNEPRQVDIEYWRAKTASTNNTVSTGLTAERITLIKKGPLSAPTLTMSSSTRGGNGTSGNTAVTSSLNLASSSGSGLINAKDSGTTITGTFSVAPNYQANDVIIFSFDFTDSEDVITKTEARIKLASTYSSSSTSFSGELLTVSQKMRGASVTYTCILEEDDPLFELKFPRFAYRYKYNNGQYSAFSPFSNAAFLPDTTVGAGSGFEYNAKDGYNLAMVNTLRSLTLANLNHNIDDTVDEIDVLYKDSVGNNCYVVDTIKRNGGTIASTFEVKDDQVFKVLPANQLLRLFDSVPKKAKALDITANRIILGNYTHQFDLPTTPPTFDIKLKNRYTAGAADRVQKQSIKSNRKYQIGVVYSDEYGRQTPVLTDKSGIIKVPPGQAKNLTKFNAKITTSAPSGMVNYKYFIKEISKTTHNLCIDSFYQDDQGYMYLSLPSSEINKVKEDDIILIKKGRESIPSSFNNRVKVLDKLTTPPSFLARPLESTYKPHELKYSAQYGDGTTQTTIKAGCTPVPNHNTICLLSYFKWGDSSVDDALFKKSGVTNGVSRQGLDALSPGKKVRFENGANKSDVYTVKQVEMHETGGDDVEVTFEEEFGDDVKFLYDDYEDNPTTATIHGILVGIDEVDKSGSPEFEGRFFLKIKADDNLLSELVGTNPANLNAIATTNGVDGDPQASPSGTSGVPGNPDRQYLIRFGGKGGANSSTTASTAASSGGFGTSAGGRAAITDSSFGTPAIDLTKGWHITLQTTVDFDDSESRYGTSPFANNLKVGNYISFFNKTNDGNAVNASSSNLDDNHYKIEEVDVRDHSGGQRIYTLRFDKDLVGDVIGAGGVTSFFETVDNSGNKMSITVSEFSKDSLKDITNPPIFEVEPQDDVDIDIYYETQENFTVASDHGNFNDLSYYNCFGFDNGVESFIIRDDFNAPALGKGVRVSTIFEDNYQEETVKSGLIFSQIYNSKASVNHLNQFIIAEPIVKNLNPGYGSIQLLHTRYNDIIAYCEDKVLKVLTNKDALFNADGSANVTSNKAVLGQAIPYNSNYGIGTNPESFADFTYRGYFVDKKSGIVVRHSADGMEEVSNYGMKDYFRDNLRAQTGFIYGSYDEKKSQYNVSLPTSVNASVSFSESINGWPSRKSFTTEGGVSINGQYFTFKNGHIYKHHTGTRNTFYGTKTDSEVTFIFNESPANIKNFRTLNYEGDSGWTCDSIVTDQQDGSVSSFIEKENKYYNYISGIEETESTIDLKALNVQGIGAYASQAVVSSNRVFTFAAGFIFNNDIQIGDKLYYVDGSSNNQDLGKITAIDKTNKTITIVNTGEVPQAAAFMFYAKNAAYYTSGLLGYHAETKMKNTSTDSKEIYSVGSEVSISS